MPFKLCSPYAVSVRYYHSFLSENSCEGITCPLRGVTCSAICFGDPQMPHYVFYSFLSHILDVFAQIACGVIPNSCIDLNYLHIHFIWYVSFEKTDFNIIIIMNFRMDFLLEAARQSWGYLPWVMAYFNLKAITSSVQVTRGPVVCS